MSDVCMYVCRVRVAARVRTLSFSFFSFLRRSSSLEEELELLSLSLELEPGIRPGLRTSALWRAASVERRVGDLCVNTKQASYEAKLSDHAVT